MAKGIIVTPRLWLPRVWSIVVALLLLGPALGWGYVLSYDMVWVPDLAVTPDALGLGPGLPRAVPSDAVIGVLDELVPGALLQKVVLVGLLVAAGVGAAESLPDAGWAVRAVAVSVYVWNPFVVERLVMGHWPVLLGYALFPWLIFAARAHRLGSPRAWWLWLLLPLGSLSASAGLASAAVALAFGVGRSLRRNLALAGAVVAANAPWVVSGLLHAGVSRTDPAGAEVFALKGEGLLPAPLAALGGGGIWNAEVVPTTREGPLAVALLLVLMGLALLGIAGWWHLLGRRDRVGYVTLWGVGLGLAVLSWSSPATTGWLAQHFPGGGLLRDGSRLLGLCFPLVALLVPLGAGRLGRMIGGRTHASTIVALLALGPLALMPDAGWGSSGRLAAVSFPPSYDRVRQAVGDANGGDVLLLPFSSYRAPAWNGGRKVLNPLGRYLDAQVVASDDLVVSGRVIDGEDPRGPAVKQALAADTADARAADLARLGISVYVVDRESPGSTPEIAGRILHADREYLSVRLSDPAVRRPPTSWMVWMVLAWTAFLASIAIGMLVRRRPPVW